MINRLLSFRTLAVFALGAALGVACDNGSEPEAVPATPTAAASEHAPAATSAPTRAASQTASAQYAGTTNWLCHPAKTATPCTSNLDSTILDADGKLTPDPFKPVADARIDCFYVYPTTSNDTTVNSDLSPGNEERVAAASQAARLGSVCRVFAPVYRQLTVSSILSGAYLTNTAARDTAYGDVLAAWKQYLSTENNSRGVVLIGHSQGAMHLKRLVREEIDAKPEARARLVSALLFGNDVQVPLGKDVGGDFASIPACRKPEQVGCVVSYASFSAASGPPPNSLFARRSSPSSQALCVNPAAPAGGEAELHTFGPPGANPFAASVKTTWVSYSGLVRGECVTAGDFSYLKVTASPSVNLAPFSRSAEWGLHTFDVSLAMGDIVALVGKQAAAFKAP